MYKVLLFCITSFILVPIVTSAVLNTVPLTMDAWSLGVTVPRGAAPRYTLLTWTADKYYEEISFELVPCYGAISWWLNFNTMPNSTVNLCNGVWTPLSPAGKCNQVAIGSGTKMYVLVQGLAQYKYNPYNAAIFDVALYSNSTVLQDLIPVPGGSGAVDISGTQTDATVSWTGTGNGNDTYSVYKFYGNMPLSTSGFINYTACGAATFMKNLGTVEADASGAATYKETNLAGAKTSFTIVANRIGGYSTAYGPISVGGGNMLSVPIVFILLCIIIAFNQ